MAAVGLRIAPAFVVSAGTISTDVAAIRVTRLRFLSTAVAMVAAVTAAAVIAAVTAAAVIAAVTTTAVIATVTTVAAVTSIAVVTSVAVASAASVSTGVASAYIAQEEGGQGAVARVSVEADDGAPLALGGHDGVPGRDCGTPGKRRSGRWRDHGNPD